MAEVGRRDALRLLALAAVGGVAGCTTSRDDATPQRSPSTPTSATPLPRATTSSLPRTTPWRAGAGEVSPSVKTRVARLLETAGTWSDGEGAADARTRAAALDVPDSVLDGLAPLFGAGRSAALQVVGLQYGGILARSASVLAVVNQWTVGQTGDVRAGGTTFDVRLTRASPRWRVTAVNPARPGRPTGTVSRAASAVLADERIVLPYAARADVESGQVHDVVLRALTRLAGEATVHVSVLRSGHPLFVFGTSRRSDHPRGFAADIWRFGDLRVVDPANRSRVEEFMRAASATGAYQVGGPVDLDGGGRAYFSDATHQDHVHLGFRG